MWTVRDNKLDDPLEREKLRHVFERGLGQPVGYVLPLKRAEGKSGPRGRAVCGHCVPSIFT